MIFTPCVALPSLETSPALILIIIRRQEAQATLVAAVLEQLHGMHVIKAFNLTGRGDQIMRRALEIGRAHV